MPLMNRAVLVIIPALVFAVIVALTTSACGPKYNVPMASGGSGSATAMTLAQSVDGLGNCTALFVSNYNKVVTQAGVAAAMFNSGLSTSDLAALAAATKVSNACAAFGTGGQFLAVNCQALVNQSAQPVQSLSLQQICQLAQFAGSGAPPTAAPSGSSGASGASILAPGSGPSSASGAVAPPPPVPVQVRSPTAAPLARLLAGQTLPPVLAVIPHASASPSGAAPGVGQSCSGAFVNGYVLLLAQLNSSSLSAAAKKQDCATYLSGVSSPVSCQASINGSVQTISTDAVRLACTNATGFAF